MKNVASDLAVVLEAAGLSLTRPPSGLQNLYTAPMPEKSDDGQVPDKCVALLNYGGGSVIPYLNGNRRSTYVARCQALIRAGREDFADGQTLAFAVHDALHLKTVSGYLEVRAREASPTYLGTDKADRHLWSLNLEAMYVATLA